MQRLKTVSKLDNSFPENKAIITNKPQLNPLFSCEM